jgi:hypothetical protein
MRWVRGGMAQRNSELPVDQRIDIEAGYVGDVIVEDSDRLTTLCRRGACNSWPNPAASASHDRSWTM